MSGDVKSAEGPRVLLWMLEATPDLDEEWNEWYSTEHVAALMHVPGFRIGVRYRIEEEYTRDDPPVYLAFYDLDGAEVLRSESYRTNRASLGEGQRPAWTRRMMAAVTKARGGVYVPTVQGEFAPGAASPESLLAIGTESASNAWVDDVLVQSMRGAAGLTTLRDLTIERISPSAANMRERDEPPRRFLLFGFETDEQAKAAWTSVSQSIAHVSLAARYSRILTATPAG